MGALRFALPGHAEKIGPVFIEVSLEGSCRVIHCRDLQPSGQQRSSLLSRSELCCQFMSLGILLVDDSTALRRELVYATFNDSSLIVTNTISTDDSVASIREVEPSPALASIITSLSGIIGTLNGIIGALTTIFSTPPFLPRTDVSCHECERQQVELSLPQVQLDNQRRGTAFPVMLALNQTAGQADGFLSVQLRQRIFPHKAREYPRVPESTRESPRVSESTRDSPRNRHKVPHRVP